MFDQNGFIDDHDLSIDYSNSMWGIKRAIVRAVYPKEFLCDIELAETGTIFTKVPFLCKGGKVNNEVYLTYELPAQNDTVLVAFVDGNSVAPVILGSLIFFNDYENPKMEGFLDVQNDREWILRRKGFEIRVSEQDEKCYIQKNSGNNASDGTLKIEIDFANDKIKIGASGSYEKLFKCETVQKIINANNLLYNGHTHPAGAPPVVPMTDIQTTDFSEIIETE